MLKMVTLRFLNQLSSWGWYLLDIWVLATSSAALDENFNFFSFLPCFQCDATNEPLQSYLAGNLFRSTVNVTVISHFLGFQFILVEKNYSRPCALFNLFVSALFQLIHAQVYKKII